MHRLFGMTERSDVSKEKSLSSALCIAVAHGDGQSRDKGGGKPKSHQSQKSLGQQYPRAK